MNLSEYLTGFNFCLDAIADVSMVKSALPNSTIHRKTPMINYKYFELVGHISEDTSVSGQ